MFDRMVGARENGRRMLRKEAETVVATATVSAAMAARNFIGEGSSVIPVPGRGREVASDPYLTTNSATPTDVTMKTTRSTQTKAFVRTLQCRLLGLVR